MARVLITGAHGFIGQKLARRLSSSGHRVLGLGHGIWPEAEALHCGVARWLNGEIAPGNLRLLHRDEGAPDLVFHLAGGSSVGAALANPREDFFRTVATTADLLEWLRLDAPGAKLVAVSSAAVYGAGHDGPIAENATLTPYSPYGHHKRLMEELCRSYAASYGQATVVARLFSVYGTGLKKQLLWDACSRLATGADPLILGGSGGELRDWTEVRDVVRALELLAPKASTEVPVFNVGTGIATPVRDIAAAIAAAWAAPGGTPAALSFSGQGRPGDPFSLVARAQGLVDAGFAWEMGLHQGLADYVAWFRAQAGATGK